MMCNEPIANEPALDRAGRSGSRRLFHARILGGALVTGAILAVGFGLRAFGQSEVKPAVPTKEIRAQQFVLVDDQNRTLASLMRGDDGRPALVLWNADETAMVSVEIAKGGMPRITLESGKSQVSMGFIDSGSSVFAMCDAKGTRRFTTTVFRDAVSVRLYDDQKRERWRIGLDEHGRGFAGLMDEQGRPRASVIHDDTGVGLDIMSESGKSVASMQVDPNGRGDIGIVHEEGKAGVVMQSDADGGKGNIAIFEDSKPIWRARKP